MNFCQPHWDRLRAEVDRRGLSGFLPDSGEQGASQLQRAAEESEPSIDSFDPLMAANLAIFSAALSLVGVVLMTPNEDGSPRCPLCYLQARHDEECTDEGCDFDLPTVWIEGAVNDQVLALRELS